MKTSLAVLSFSSPGPTSWTAYWVWGIAVAVLIFPSFSVPGTTQPPNRTDRGKFRHQPSGSINGLHAHSFDQDEHRPQAPCRPVGHARMIDALRRAVRVTAAPRPTPDPRHLPRRQMQPLVQRILGRFLDRFADRRMGEDDLGHVLHRHLLVQQGARRRRSLGDVVPDHVHAQQLARLAMADDLHEAVGIGRPPSPCPGATAGTARSRPGRPFVRASSAGHAHGADLGEGVDAVGNRGVEVRAHGPGRSRPPPRRGPWPRGPAGSGRSRRRCSNSP